MKLTNKTTIITGASSGMGKAIAKLFLQEGATVIGIDIRQDRLQEVATAWANPNFHPYVGDVTNKERMESILDEIHQNTGKIDILINNAGIMDNMEPIGELTDHTWNKILAINLTGPMILTRKAIHYMEEQGHGNIINITSIGGIQGSRAGVAYTASKHALMGLTKNTAFMYANKGIRCNAICPGAVATDIGSTMTAPSPLGLERAMAGMSTNPRTGNPEEIAQAALFLASDEASFVNGATLVVDGGWTAY